MGEGRRGRGKVGGGGACVCVCVACVVCLSQQQKYTERATRATEPKKRNLSITNQNQPPPEPRRDGQSHRDRAQGLRERLPGQHRGDVLRHARDHLQIHETNAPQDEAAHDMEPGRPQYPERAGQEISFFFLFSFARLLALRSLLEAFLEGVVLAYSSSLVG